VQTRAEIGDPVTLNQGAWPTTVAAFWHGLQMLKRLSRRQLLAALGALPAVAFLGHWLRRIRTPKQAALDPEVVELISRVCDRFVPSVGGRPGVVTLAIDKKIMRDWRRVPKLEKQLLELGNLLREDQFLSMNTEQQDTYLRKRLRERKAGRPFRHLLDRCVRDFYTHPQSWVSLRYTKPQPEGYSDYARCG